MAIGPTHYVALGIIRGGTHVGLTSVGFNVDPEPTSLADVTSLGDRITTMARDEGDLGPDMHYLVLSWQRLSKGKRRG